MTQNPYRSDIDLSLPEPDQATWSKLSIVLTTETGLIVDAELLCPNELIEQLDLAMGRTMYFSVPELELNSWGTLSSTHYFRSRECNAGTMVSSKLRDMLLSRCPNQVEFKAIQHE
ncbi:MAG: hypothetical protein KDB00_21060 [Planctomycetales bacterium]|nr:hypothetical protein [Planctomycetales bacterium]